MVTNKLLQKLLALTLSFMMIFTMLPFDIISPINTNGDSYGDNGINVAYGNSGAYVGGSTGNITSHVGVRGSGGGIAGAVFDDPGAVIAIYRDKDTSQYNKKADIIFRDILTKGAPINNKMIAPLYVYTDKVLPTISKLVIGKAVGNNNLVGEVPDRVIWRASRTSNPVGTSGVYYNAIKDKYGNLSNWETYIDSGKNASKQAWEYILNTSNYDISGKIINIFGLLPLNHNKDLSDAEAKEQWLKYLDFLMSLYAISMGTGSQNHWKVAIDDYVNSNNLKDSPVNVVIEPATMVNAHGQGHIAISWIDYMNFYAGTATNYAIDKDYWHTTNQAESSGTVGKIYEQFLKSVQNSIIETPSLQRISRAYVESNPWSHGVSALTWYRFTTAGNNARWGNHSSSTNFAVTETMWIGDKKTTNSTHWGLLAILMPKHTPSSPLGRLVALPDNQPIETETLGIPVTLDIFSGASDNDKKTWESIIANVKLSNGNFKVTISNMERTSAQKPGQGTYIPTIPLTQTMSPEEFTAWLNEESAIRVIDDGTIGISVDRTTEKGVTFNYKCKLTIEYGSTVITKAEKEITDTASFIILPERIGYTSKPEAYAEIKNYGSGSNMSGTIKERWEAMAGVPSTEQLYFAAGGSEFIVDVTLEYTQAEKAVRSYDSYYTKTDCEFKNGDQAKTYTVPSPSGASSSDVTLQVHEGDLVVTATWTGQIPNKATAVTALHSATCPAQPDRTAYNTAKSQAQAWVSALNSHIISHTSVSDKQKRDYKLSASITTDSPNDPQTTSASVSCSYKPATETSSGTPCGNEMATANPGGPGSYTITVTSTIPHHVICGPCCSHELPEIHDTWKQTFEYDSMRITDVHVWEIDQAAVDGMTEIISTDIINAQVVVGEPNIFYNIAMKNNANYTKETNNRNPVTTNDKATYSSEVGRIRYKVSPEQHDTVKYDLGVRTNKCDGMSKTYSTNVSANGGSGHSHNWSTGIIYNSHIGSASTNGQYFGQQAGNKTYPVNTVGYLQANTDDKDKSTTEYAAFLQKRQQPQTATMITDFLILQTSNGSQSVMYYHQTTPQGSITAEHEIPKMTVTKETMWDNNSNSASEWEEDHINVGSYNGNYKSETDKWKVSNNGSEVATIFDSSDPAKANGNTRNVITRTTKPSRNLMLYKGEQNIILRNTNKSYQTGKAEVFWQNLLHWTDVTSDRFNVNPAPAPYSTTTTIGPETGFNFGAKVGTNNDQSNASTTSRAHPSSMFKAGFVLHAPYSEDHAKVNDLIVHDPVSTENAVLISLPNSRDQRTNSAGGAADAIEGINKSQICPRDPALCDFRHLINNGDCDYFRDSVLLNMDFDTRDPSGNPINKVTGNSIELPSGFSITNAPSGMTGKVLKSTSGRLEIPFSELGLTYTRSLRLKVEADAIIYSNTAGQMLFSFHSYDAYILPGYNGIFLNTGNGAELHAHVDGKDIADGKKHHIAIVFSMTKTDRCEVYIDGVKAKTTRINPSRDIDTNRVGKSIGIGSWGTGPTTYPLRGGYVDNFKITRLAGTTEHTADEYILRMTHPNGLNKHVHSQADLNGVRDGSTSTGSQTFNFTGTEQLFTAPETGNYTLEVWGAQGGSAGNGTGGKGGYSKGTVYLNKGETLRVYVGSQPNGQPNQAGWNGGGASNNAAGGGGATDIRRGGSGLDHRIIVAGGGGGGGSTGNTSESHTGGAGGGNTGGDGATSGNSGKGGTQTAGGTAYSSTYYGSKGQGGTGSGHGSGGGGGYFGGGGGYSCSSGGGGGSGYIGGVTGGTMSSGSKTGNGQAKITWTIQGKYKNGAEWFVQEFTDGNITEQQAKDILGDAYEPIMANSFGPVIHTWSGWTTSNMMGFNPLNQVTLSASSNNLVQQSSGSDPHFNVPVDFSASGVTKIEVTLDNSTASTSAQLFWERNTAAGYTSTKSVTATMKANTNNQVVTFVVRNHAQWKDIITSLRFDLGNASGKITVKNIKVYGAGSKVAGGGSGTGTVVWESGTPGSYTFNAPAGNYKLEVWGAQGGSYNASVVGGKGGYSFGEVTLNSQQTLYISVGGQGSWGFSANGGYNGGGSIGHSGASGNGAGSGGGATHIAKRTGLLSALSSYKSDVLIVAGGGGGGVYGNDGGQSGGAGGGTNGLNGSGSGYGTPSAGTQTSGGSYGNINNHSSYTNGAFGQGGSGSGSGNTWYGGGGGSGWYGGGYGGTHWAGSGGSGYIGGVSSGIITAGNTTMPNPSGGTMVGKTGNGYARITSTFTPIKITGSGSGDVSEGQVFNYNYTGGVQTVTLPAGTYQVELWGAQGGNSGANGTYVKDTITITNDEELVRIYVGGQGTTTSGGGGGYNGGGNNYNGYGGGGGATDIRIGGTAVGNRVVVAGGGAGASHTGTAYTTHNRYSSLGNGQSATSNHAAGGGGGYYGGTTSNSGCSSSAYSGSSYANGAERTANYSSGNTVVTYGNRAGHGQAKITALTVVPKIILTVDDIKAHWDLIPDKLPNGSDNPIWACDRKPNVHVCDDKCVEVAILDCTEPHHKGLHYDVSNPLCWEPCNDDAAHKKYKPIVNTADGSFTPGNFINIDWGFQVYYPNIGDFNQGQPYGLGSLVSTRGRGFVDSMDTTKWTRVKRIKFNINVIYKNQLYVAGEWITLSDYGTYTGADGSKYDETKWSNYGTELFDDVRGNLIDGTRKGVYQFYAVLANSEMKSSEVIIDVEAVNSRNVNDNYNSPTNRTRSRSFTALHGGTNNFYMDVVGRIGNLTLQDTTDYRFSNLLKTPIDNTDGIDQKTVYDLSILRDNTSGDVSVDGTGLYMSSAGSKVSIPDSTLQAGQYRIDVSGKALGNGKLFVTADAAWKNVGEYDRTSPGVQYVNNVNNIDFKLTGPNVDLDVGQYKMTVNGSGFTMAEFKLWENKGLPSEKILETTAEYKEDGKITYYFTLDNPIKNVSITTEFSEVTQEFTFDNIVIDKLDEGTTVDMVANGHVTKIVETSNAMAYYLTVPSDATVSLGWIANNNKGLALANITLTRLGDHAEGWIIDNVVKKVDESNQNYYLGWKRDIRGVDVSNETKWLNTYSTRNWMDGNILRFPLSPSQNNISILQDEPMLPGYDLLLDISTIGNYYRNNASLLQVMPYYYALNVNTGELTPLDVYMKLESAYAPVNIFNNYNENGSLKMPVYNYVINLDWLNENVRRNYTAVEQMQTDFFRTKFAEGGSSTDTSGITTGDSAGESPLPYKQLDAPVGSFYTLGNAQVLQATGKARTFIGGETTYGTLMNLGGSNQIKTDPQNERKYNPNGRVTDYDWWAAAQRWHFKVGVPSSTVFVKHHNVDSFNPDREITNDMIEEFKSSDYVVLCTADIRVVGDTYVLKYSHEEDNGSIKIRKKDGSWSADWKLPTNIPPVLAVYSAEITTEYDISITRTH